MLTAEQLDAKQEVITRLQDQPFVTLGGYAGTGKTTLIKSLVETLPGAKVMAFTGKAAHVLRKKGVNASTIHSAIYDLIRDEEGKPVLDENRNLQWIRNENFDAKYIIIDEASMVPEKIFEDIGEYGIPTIFVGDHGQLPPVGDAFNLMVEPDITLETIHRNAGEIARFANFLREDNNPTDWVSEGSVHITDFPTLSSDQVICGFNKTRKEINLGITRTTEFKPGHKVIVLNNDSRYNVFNGMQGIVDSVEKYKLTFTCDDKQYSIPFSRKYPESKSPHSVSIGHAYCITCHKAQGDEWDSVTVIEEQCDFWEAARWNYTAASRARKTLYWNQP